VIDGTMVIDFHGHTGGNESNGMKDDPALMIRTLDAAGVDKACLFNCFHPTGRPGNDLTARFVAMHPDRFIGFAYVSPIIPPDEMRAELTRAFDELGFIGIKAYSNYFPWGYSAPQYDPIYEFANERGAPVIFHTGVEPKSRPALLAEFAPRFPNAYFVAGHSGNMPEGRAEAIAAANAHPNIYLETCSTYRTPGAIEELVNGAGAERVLYGSDQPLMDPRPQIGKIITADISDEAKRLVLGGNARRLLGL